MAEPGETIARPAPGGLPADAVDLATGLDLSVDEAHYVGAARAANTVRGYRSDWTEWAAWCAAENQQPLPAEPAKRTEVLALAARRRASNVRVFGSVVRGQDGPSATSTCWSTLPPAPVPLT